MIKGSINSSRHSAHLSAVRSSPFSLTKPLDLPSGFYAGAQHCVSDIHWSRLHVAQIKTVYAREHFSEICAADSGISIWEAVKRTSSLSPNRLEVPTLAETSQAWCFSKRLNIVCWLEWGDRIKHYLFSVLLGKEQCLTNQNRSATKQEEDCNKSIYCVEPQAPPETETWLLL